MNYIRFLFATAFILFAFFSCHENKEATSTQHAPQDIVEVTVSKPGGVEEINANNFMVSGKLESSNSSDISAKIMGKVLRVNVREGQQVKQGQTVVIIKADDLHAQKSQAGHAISEAQAALVNAQANYTRFKTLYDQQSATKFELDNAKMQLDMAKSRVSQAQSSQRQVSTIISESNVTAPFSGTVTAKYVEAGSIASPGMPLLTIEATGNLVLKALIPESEVHNVKSGQVVEIIFQANKEKTSGTIALVNPSTQFTGSQYEIEIRINGSTELKKQLKPGMYANIIIPRIYPKQDSSSYEVNTVTIPKSALIEKGQLKGLYTVSKDNKAILRWVRTGKDYGDKVEIISGLNADESYVLQANSKLYNGASVKIK